jgi:hypothetical protein
LVKTVISKIWRLKNPKIYSGKSTLNNPIRNLL